MDLRNAAWYKSSHSGSNGGQCVEVARNLPSIVAVRDSKDPAGHSLTFTPAQWEGFINGARDGEFNLA